MVLPGSNAGFFVILNRKNKSILFKCVNYRGIIKYGCPV
jgi:hypothetical protein